MRDLVLALFHLAVVTARLCGSDGVRAVMAENLLLKPQLIVLRRTRKRAPNLSATDRLLSGFRSMFRDDHDGFRRLARGAPSAAGRLTLRRRQAPSGAGGVRRRVRAQQQLLRRLVAHWTDITRSHRFHNKRGVLTSTPAQLNRWLPSRRATATATASVTAHSPSPIVNPGGTNRNDTRPT